MPCQSLSVYKSARASWAVYKSARASWAVDIGPGQGLVFMLACSFHDKHFEEHHVRKLWHSTIFLLEA